MILDWTEEFVEQHFEHYGTPRHSGRYPWGSSGNVEEDEKAKKGYPQRSATFLDMVDHLKAQGLSDKLIVKGMMDVESIAELRAKKTIAKNAIKRAEIDYTQSLRDKGMSNVKIAEAIYGNPKKESNVRANLAPGAREKADILLNVANALKDEVDKKKYLDVGGGTEHFLGVSETKKKAALAILKQWGYETHTGIKIPQLNNPHETELAILTRPDTEWADAARNKFKVKQIVNFSDDGGRSFFGLHPPISVNSKRVEIMYKGEGGEDADGVIYIRPGVEDLSIGNSSYAQVRVLVDDTHYLKGMAVYSDDIPEGKDLVFNTVKDRDPDPHKAMKPISDDPDNPFGASVKQLGTQGEETGGESDGSGEIVRQLIARDADGTEKVTSAMNIVNSEGAWLNWSKNLSSQFLSKQSPKVAKQQLDLTYENREADFNEIMELTNPTVRAKLLEEFADNADSAAVHLKAAALPRQNTQVLMPLTSMKKTEVYAPNYDNGDTIALIRYPHGGTFEIPVLTVNNKSRKAKKLLGTARDAVAIHPQVAEQLSGADFDGDTVVTVPNNGVKADAPLEALKGFDPRMEFKGYEGMTRLEGSNKQTEMGRISNLITDMTIQNAPPSKIARAIKHSMVVIDAEKHGLDYKRSEDDNGIRALRQEFQINEDGKVSKKGGAVTLISRAGADVRIPKRKARLVGDGGPIDTKTGKLMYQPTNEVNKEYTTKKGTLVPEGPKLEKHKKLAITDDAHTLSSGTPIERLYADHSNRLKDLANKARLEMLGTKNVPRVPSATKAYATQVDSLSAKLTQSERNRPLERAALALANAEYTLKRQANPNMTDDIKKRVKRQLRDEMRARTGAQTQEFGVDDEEWDAIQAGAISPTKLKKVLNNADSARIKELATPRTKRAVTPAKLKRAQSMMALGYTRAEVAGQLGIPIGTLDEALYGEGS